MDDFQTSLLALQTIMRGMGNPPPKPVIEVTKKGWEDLKAHFANQTVPGQGVIVNSFMGVDIIIKD